LQELQGVNEAVISEPESELLKNKEAVSEQETSYDGPLFQSVSEDEIKEILASGTKLSVRLSVPSRALGKNKDKMTLQEFAEFSSNKDPDGVSWGYLEDKKRFTPVSSLNSELKSKLIMWLEEPVIDDTPSKDLKE